MKKKQLYDIDGQPYYPKTDPQDLAAKQDVITDLEDIRRNAAAIENAEESVDRLSGYSYSFNFVNAAYENNSFVITDKTIGRQQQLAECHILYLGSNNTATQYPQEGVKNTNGYRPARDTLLRIHALYPGTIVELYVGGITAEQMNQRVTNLTYIDTSSQTLGSTTVYTHRYKISEIGDAIITLSPISYAYYKNIYVYLNNSPFVFREEYEISTEEFNEIFS